MGIEPTTDTLQRSLAPLVHEPPFKKVIKRYPVFTEKVAFPVEKPGPFLLPQQ